MYTNIGAVLHQRGDYAGAVAVYRRSLELRPNSSATHRNVGDALSRLGKNTEARREYLEAVRLAEVELQVNPRDGRNLAALAVYLAKAGDYQAARARLAEANEIAGNELQVIYRGAVVEALQGHVDQALAALERLVTLGYPRQSIAGDDDFESLRAFPRFQALVSSTAPKGGSR